MFDNHHMLWIGIWIHHHTITTTCASLDLGSQLKSCITAWQHKWCQGAVVEALTQHRIVLTYAPKIWNVFDKLHKLWIGIWIHHHTITTTCAGLDLRFGKTAEILYYCCVTKMMPRCSGWCSNPSWNSSHMYFYCMKCVWQTLYAVDGHIDPSPHRFHHMCWPRFGKSAEIRYHCWAIQTMPRCSGCSSNTWNGSQLF